MRLVCILTMSGLLAGCVSVPTGPLTANDIFPVSKQVLIKDYSVFIPYKEQVLSGNLQEFTVDVARYMAQAEKRPKGLSISSFSPEATAKVVKAALAMNEGKNLSRLTVLYFGEKQYEKELKAAVHAAGAKFYFREFRSGNDRSERDAK